MLQTNRKRGIFKVLLVALILAAWILVSIGYASAAFTERPDLMVTAIKPYHYQWSEDYSRAMGEPFFNLQNYVNVTVKNNGTTTAANAEVKLYDADDKLLGSETIADLRAGKQRELRFSWTPEGEDPLSWTHTAQGAKLIYTDTNKNYTLKAVVDEDEKVQELNESNNELTRELKVVVVWNGFAADEPLEEYAHDVINGGVILTTGDAVYRSDEAGDSGTIYGKPYDINYDLQIPGSTKLARFYIYYTWAEPAGSVPKAPKIGLTLQTPKGTSTKLSLDASYNDVKGDFLNFRFSAWGTYAYDVTNYVRENGTYVVTVENINDGSDGDFTKQYSFAAPAMLVVYENATAPKREYWINEGADILMGGRRSEGGFLCLEDCLNSAEFSGEHVDLEVEEAVLGVVTPWADDAKDDVITFNGQELGKGLYYGYFDAWSSSKEFKGISMHIGADEAQQGMAAIDVTRYLEDDDNEVIQGDDGDNMMAANAFLLVEYGEGEGGLFDTGPGIYPSMSGTHCGYITPRQSIMVTHLYTYPCTGTGGHSEYAAIAYPNGTLIAEANWNGYTGDWYNLTFNNSFTLYANETYNYTIRTGSYPQIIHEPSWNATGGVITCTEFVDTNGKWHEGWIPAIRLEGERTADGDSGGGITDLGTPIFGASNLWALTTGIDGKIYGACDAYHAFVYDPTNNTSIDLGITDFEWYSLTAGKNGLIYAGGAQGYYGGRAHFAVYDPNRSWNPGTLPDNNPYDMGPAIYTGDPTAIIHDLTTGIDGKIYGGTGYAEDIGTYDYAYLFEYDPGTKAITNLGMPIPGQQGLFRLTTGIDGKIYGASSDGHLFVYDPNTGNFTDLGAPRPESNIVGLTPGIAGSIYGGTGDGYLFFYDPPTNTTTVLGKVVPDVILRLTTGKDGKIYGGEGPHGYFFVYYPWRAWNPGDTPENNPYNMGQAVPGETRIRSLTAGIEGKIYGGTAWNAHLFVYSP